MSEYTAFERLFRRCVKKYLSKYRFSYFDEKKRRLVVAKPKIFINHVEPYMYFEITLGRTVTIETLENLIKDIESFDDNIHVYLVHVKGKSICLCGQTLLKGSTQITGFI